MFGKNSSRFEKFIEDFRRFFLQNSLHENFFFEKKTKKKEIQKTKIENGKPYFVFSSVFPVFDLLKKIEQILS